MNSINEPISIRPFRKSDTEQIARLFHETVRNVNNKDYTEAQLRAWAPDDIHFKDWETSCLQNYTYVAEEDNIITGFAQLEADGHIDCFYCHKDYQGRGIGSALFNRLEQKVVALKLERLYAEVSITALPFFKAAGFSEVKKQEVSIRGELLTNYVMEKMSTL